MDRIKGFLTALALMVLTAVGLHFYAAAQTDQDPEGYALWTWEEKSLSFSGLSGNLRGNMIPVFGSSEFQHGNDTPYHPCRLFRKSGFTPMLIGAGYYQSLSHAVTLAAIEKSMPVRKTVLIVSPQWFRKTGVVDQAYTSRFSERIYQEMLLNDSLSRETKDYIRNRTALLLKGDAQTLSRILLDEKVLTGEKTGCMERMRQVLWTEFLKEKDRISTAFWKKAAQLKGRYPSAPEVPDGTDRKTPDWSMLLEMAENAGEIENTNPFFIDDKSYARLLPVLDLKKGMNADADRGYQTGPEFADLECFLNVCLETGVEPMLVLVPVNGYYYDFTEFPVSARQAYYEKIREIAGSHGALLADFSGDEYTKYFFEDRVHLGKKGWVKVSEAIYRFAAGSAG